MKNPVESLLEDDHESLAQLLTELDGELAKHNFPHAFELLDLFWARLAVHIRAENLHLFPALANARASLFTGTGGLPTRDEAHTLLLQLRSDHNFFMKELSEMIKTMREIADNQRAPAKEIEGVRKRMIIIKKRLETHNQLEEEQAYTWPSLLFDEPMVARLSEHLRHELENLPPRFSNGGLP
ncbi:MAG TPA: hemerythrin domain-containing protein [Pyrinomonadaceae bacterium]|nr:hemerythrin domain-containing protein [Pyrinomonadaceae bacterium]